MLQHHAQWQPLLWVPTQQLQGTSVEPCSADDREMCCVHQIPGGSPHIGGVHARQPQTEHVGQELASFAALTKVESIQEYDDIHAGLSLLKVWTAARTVTKVRILIQVNTCCHWQWITRCERVIRPWLVKRKVAISHVSYERDGGCCDNILESTCKAANACTMPLLEAERTNETSFEAVKYAQTHSN